MSTTSLLAIMTISLNIFPLTCHRLITNPYPDQEWDSVIVSSDPITIREKTHNDTKLNEILKPQKRSYEECPENDFSCLYGEKDNDRIVEKFFEQYSRVAEDDGGSTDGKNFENPGKSYWTAVDSQTHNHPYDDRKGWITLDPVPWSTSKISKWHPNKVGIYEATTQHPVQEFWVAGSSHYPQRPSSQWAVGTNDIITDNKPSNFPTEHQGFQGYTGNYNQFYQNQEMKNIYPPRYPQNVHPSTYPDSGNGEWILLSTTKGYSHPQRNRWAGRKHMKSTRNIKPIEISKYHEEDLNEKLTSDGKNPTGNRKSDANELENIGNSTSNGSAEKPLVQILYTGTPKYGESVTTLKRKIRLQVLPSLESSSTSHGGLLEVDSNSQTVDEAQQEDEQMKKLKAIANVKKNKIRGFKLVPMSKVTGKGVSHKNMMTLAAVGAGMIPATMALLVPMALGKRKRSLSQVLLTLFSGSSTFGESIWTKAGSSLQVKPLSDVSIPKKFDFKTGHEMDAQKQTLHSYKAED